MSGNLPPQPVTLTARAKAAEREWKRGQPAADQKVVPASIDRPAAGDKVRVRQTAAEKAKAGYLAYLKGPPAVRGRLEFRFLDQTLYSGAGIRRVHDVLRRYGGGWHRIGSIHQMVKRTRIGVREGYPKPGMFEAHGLRSTGRLVAYPDDLAGSGYYRSVDEAVAAIVDAEREWMAAVAAAGLLWKGPEGGR